MRGLSLYITLLAVALCGSLQAQVYRTEPVAEEVKTLRTIVDGDYKRLPVIDLEGNSQVEISFDYLADEQPWLNYRIVHCDAEWQQDDMNELDYMEGVLPVRLEEVEPSFNTITTSYYHYSVCFPNEHCKLLLSGNYAVVFGDDDDEERTVAVATFSVSEQGAFVKGEVSGVTDIDYLQRHQQLSLNVNWSTGHFPHMNAAEELTLVVRQNRRDDMRHVVRRPLRMEQGAVVYEHCKELIFEGCNTWRQFENIDHRYPGIHVDRVSYSHEGYYTFLLTDGSRAHREFFTQQDVKGRYLVHAVKVDDVNTECEYSWVRFSLKAPVALDEAGVYLMGDFTYGRRSEEFRMVYDAAEELYVKDVYLKQGAYNYLYSTSAIEGNHYETPNEYDVYIYYRPFGARYDRLLGTGIIQ